LGQKNNKKGENAPPRGGPQEWKRVTLASKFNLKRKNDAFKKGKNYMLPIFWGFLGGGGVFFFGVVFFLEATAEKTWDQEKRKDDAIQQ